ncbi:exostosin family [Seminavis robusta]|uniref:Exostosin family n=1 Tax=Seminavis robusta TaxID=568900 RepID=A0A9N8H7N7_9STRA|nr:exostosin family [Seminavis robusta]|eukprot:Sro186_g080790.1 exostosin family (537) ;mRNA; f:89621-91371
MTRGKTASKAAVAALLVWIGSTGLSLYWSSQVFADSSSVDAVKERPTLAFNARLYEKAGKKWDDFSTGKSCVWKQKSTSKNSGRWHCQECTDSHHCVPLQPRGECPPFPLINWDVDQISQRSHFRTEASGRDPTSMVTSIFDFPSVYESPRCSPDLTLPCFDLQRCPRHQPMKIYLHKPERNPKLLKAIQRALEKLPDDVAYTTRHDEGCLFLVGHNAKTPEDGGSSPEDTTYDDPDEMIHSPEYMAGQNHVIWRADTIFDAHGDRPRPHTFNFEFAALFHQSLSSSILREGYDIASPIRQAWGWTRPQQYDNLSLHRPRRVLLSFKGRIENWRIPYQHHRWLASEFWDISDKDIVIDTSCHKKPYALTGNVAYSELLLNSTFVFCPGGGGPSSMRLNDALLADAIPVVVSYLTMPFEPDVDWSGCVVRVSEARIIDLPRMLRSMSAAEIKARRETCRELFRGVMGRKRNAKGNWRLHDLSENPFLTMLRIWRRRIQRAHHTRDGQAAIRNEIRRAAVQEEQFGEETRFLEEAIRY